MPNMKDRRILELALKGLEAERDVIVAEIAELRAKLGGKIALGRRRRATKALRKEISGRAARKTASAKKRTRRMTAAQKKALSEKMKAVWARRRKTGQ